MLTCFFFFKQKTAYEMRISDWSSDVCSSDLTAERIELIAWRTSSQIQTGMALGKPLNQFFGLSSLLDDIKGQAPDLVSAGVVQIGRASCRERVCQYV